MVLTAAVLLAVSACGSAEAGSDGSGGEGGKPSGTVQVDGSSTVAPLSTVAAELFRAENPYVEVAVGTSGTGGGFDKFCHGETDISNASRAIEDVEASACRLKGVEYQELQVAGDGLSVVVSKDNDFVECLTVDQLRMIWQPGSKKTTGTRSMRRSPTRNWNCSVPARTRAPSTTSPVPSTARRAPRAPTTRRTRTTTSSCRASRARWAAWATSATPTTRRTRTG
ncbi:hypothetical protein SHIRM173S_03955 [Streptomyces hirsutus]